MRSVRHLIFAALQPGGLPRCGRLMKMRCSLNKRYKPKPETESADSSLRAQPVLFAPFAHAYACLLAKSLMKRNIRTVAAHRCDRPDRYSRRRQKKAYSFHANMLNFVQNRMPQGFPESDLQKAPRSAKSGDGVAHREALHRPL